MPALPGLPPFCLSTSFAQALPMPRPASGFTCVPFCWYTLPNTHSQPVRLHRARAHIPTFAYPPALHLHIDLDTCIHEHPSIPTTTHFNSNTHPSNTVFEFYSLTEAGTQSFSQVAVISILYIRWLSVLGRCIVQKGMRLCPCI